MWPTGTVQYSTLHSNSVVVCRVRYSTVLFIVTLQSVDFVIDCCVYILFLFSCGSIQIGDRVHSIDNIPLEACTLEEAIRLLQRSAPTVKLCIAKGGGEEQVG